MVLHLRAKPNARANQLLVADDGSVTVRLHAAPQEGQANAVLLAYLAKVFGISKSCVELLNGHASQFKKVSLLGVNEAQLNEVLSRYRAH